jgi:hypothetical protein
MSRLENDQINKDEILEMFSILGHEVARLGDEFGNAGEFFEKGVLAMQGQIDRISIEKQQDVKRFQSFLVSRNLECEFQQFIDNNDIEGR